MLTRASITDFLNTYQGMDGNQSRNHLRKFIADNFVMLVDHDYSYSDEIIRYSQLSLRKWIDKVDYCVLLSLIQAALHDWHQRDTTGNAKHDYRTDWFNAVVTALNDTNTCHPKRRGLGKSWGFPRTISKDGKSICQDIRNLAGTGDQNNAVFNHGQQPNQNSNQTGDSMSVPNPSEMMYANTCVAIHNQTLVMDGFANSHDPVTYPDESQVRDIMATMNVATTRGDDYAGAVSATVQLMSIGGVQDWQNIDQLLAMASNSDNFDTVAIKQSMEKLTASDNEPTAEPSDEPTQAKASWSIDPTLKPAIDALLKQNNNLSFDQMVDQFNEQVSKVMELSNQVTRLSNASSNVPAMPTGGVDDDLTFEVVMADAGKVFGRKVKALAFEIPTLVWRNASGDEVRHPLCPDTDDNYEFRPDHLIKFLSAHLFGQNLWLHGHTGTGKTTLAEQVAARVGFPVHRLNLDSNIERSDMVGSKELVVENGVPVTSYAEGILPRAMQQPSFLILDEMDAGQADVLFTIQRALEKKGLVLTEDGGRVVQSHPLFRFIATANSRGQGDEYGWYQGVRPMNVATLDRFGVFIEVDYLDKTTEQKLLCNKYPTLSKPEATEMCQFSTEIRQAFKTGELSTTISPRGMDSLVMYYLHMSKLMPDRKTALKKSLEVVITDRAPADSTRTVIEMADRVFSY